MRWPRLGWLIAIVAIAWYTFKRFQGYWTFWPMVAYIVVFTTLLLSQLSVTIWAFHIHREHQRMIDKTVHEADQAMREAMMDDRDTTPLDEL